MSSSLSVRKGVSQARNPTQAAPELRTALHRPEHTIFDSDGLSTSATFALLSIDGRAMSSARA